MRLVLRHPALRDALYRAFGALRGASVRTMLANRRIRANGAPDGLPLPSDRLVFLVSGTRDLRWFLESGRLAADAIRNALNAVGRPLETLPEVLDWGCGCGRVLRHLLRSGATRLSACDYTRELVAWSQRAYPQASFAVNHLEPPLPYPDATMDLVYGLSVFTHLSASLQDAWMSELARVVRPGGLALITTQGSRYAADLDESDRARFAAGELVVRFAEAEGTNVCGAYHPESLVRSLSGRHGFDVALFEPEGAKGNPHQDLVVLRRR